MQSISTVDAIWKDVVNMAASFTVTSPQQDVSKSLPSSANASAKGSGYDSVANSDKEEEKEVSSGLSPGRSASKRLGDV